LPIRESKLARIAQERAKNKLKVKQVYNYDEKPTIEEQLARLEEDIRRLKIEFDVYFNGASRLPPYDTKNRVEAHIKRLGDDRTLNYAQRFHYNSLASRYAAFRDMWRRTMQGREEGRGTAAARVAARAAIVNPQERATFVCDDAHKDVQTVKHLYDALVEAKIKCGEPIDDLSFQRFHQLIATRTERLKDHLGCERVRFSIDTEGGRVNFKAKAE
jgi:hypothetical protein